MVGQLRKLSTSGRLLQNFTGTCANNPLVLIFCVPVLQGQSLSLMKWRPCGVDPSPFAVQLACPAVRLWHPRTCCLSESCRQTDKLLPRRSNTSPGDPHVAWKVLPLPISSCKVCQTANSLGIIAAITSSDQEQTQ